MAVFALIHGGGDVGWHWHLVEAELRARGHDSVAPDLPCDDPSATLEEYVRTVVDAVGGRRNVVVVGHSYGGFTAPIVAERVDAEVLVLLAGMIPVPGEAPADWWDATGYAQAARAQAGLDGGLTGHADPLVSFYHDVPRALAEEALRRSREEVSMAGSRPWPLPAWPAVRTRFVLCREDRFFPAPFLRRLARERLGLVPDEIDGSHCVALSRPKEFAELLIHFAGGNSEKQGIGNRE